MKSAIILIDIQNDYFECGKNELYLPKQAVVYAKQALDFYRMNGLAVYHVQHISIQQGATFFLPNSTGAEIHQSVLPKAGEKVFVKHTPNAFLKTGLSEELLQNNIHHIVICGMMSHMCIDTTVRAAHDLGFLVTVLEDACTTKDLLWHGTAIPAQIVHNTFMASLNGVFAQVMQTDKFLEIVDLIL
ncbi:cysteine hydrolase family protein [Clostridium pasteurianum]|uniref:Nicotinamidase-like amidase n=1 Tax=Clostridium pasteurianum BC1 TaxID=86416 RepID=R4JZ54_CLOPA|nr:cysteine hydrolase family protein [Clostridium pasteurianum]AGK96102.1 nicotinamidase-like amidase [Clostridium pasteurianum BC1]